MNQDIRKMRGLPIQAMLVSALVSMGTALLASCDTATSPSVKVDPPRVIEILAPLGGETIAPGDTLRITVRALKDSVALVGVKFSLDSCKSWDFIRILDKTEEETDSTYSATYLWSPALEIPQPITSGNAFFYAYSYDNAAIRHQLSKAVHIR